MPDAIVVGSGGSGGRGGGGGGSFPSGIYKLVNCYGCFLNSHSCKNLVSFLSARLPRILL